MCRNEVLKIPLTYVNEEFTTFQAGKLIELSQIKDGKLDNTLNLRKKVILIYNYFSLKIKLQHL